MAKKIQTEEVNEPQRDAAGVPMIDPAEAQQAIDNIAAKNAADAQRQIDANEAAKKAFGPAPIEIVELDEAIEAATLTPEQQKAGVRFWFGEVGIHKFPDGTSYHARSNNAFITDRQLIENIKAFAAANPNAKIFIQ